MKTYKFYEDDGHGWLAVKIAEVKNFGIKITRYSYKKGDTLYLEEDCDASEFLKAYKQVYGVEPEIEHIRHNGSSPIRQYYGVIPKYLLK